ncbi:MAG: RHS repeat protein [Dehalococcoidia bacterium]|nr:RHS repeat protein [Dehalococcoidia bacterium]
MREVPPHLRCDAGRETAITYPGGSNQVTYAYDAANRLSTFTWNSNAGLPVILDDGGFYFTFAAIRSPTAFRIAMASGASLPCE